MDAFAFNLAVTIAVGTVLLMGLVAGYIKNRFWTSEPTVCLVIGTMLGPTMLNLVDFEALPVDRFFLLEEIARLTLGMAVMAAALRLPAGYSLRHAGGLAAALALGLPLMALSGAVIAYAVFELSPLSALLVGAILAPTDPVVAGSVVNGKVAKRHLPSRIRHMLTAESGANDGLGLLLVMLPLLLLQNPPVAALSEWFLRIFVWEICFAVVLGLAAGWLTGRLLIWAYDQPFSESHSTVTIGIALSITILAAVRLIGSDGILAVFFAGLMLKRAIAGRQTRHEHAQEAIGRFFELPVFILIGAMVPWTGWLELGWRGGILVGAILLLRRMPWWYAMKPLMRESRTTGDALFLGWFGPMGVASIYYSILARDRLSEPAVWTIVSLVVCVSVLVHGISGTPFTQLHGRLLARRRCSDPGPTLRKPAQAPVR